ncbi:MAG: protein kinase [Planctomycetota bacterium]
MNENPSTETQTPVDRAAARRLSLQATMPPADVPGVRLQRFLGSGAFGQVWIGRDLNTGRGVAVKFYLHRGGVNWSLLSREVKNLVQLSADRHVVQVLEVGWDADPPYYVMELIEGGSLEDLLVRQGRLNLSEAVEMFRKICTGLNHCHGKGVLHCDVKPANILIAADNEPRLADFGQSRMSHDQTPAMGTLFYMAPEQADLKSTPDARWDVYAAGAILYRMITGAPPHRDQSLISQLDTAGSLPGRLACYRDAIASAPPAMDQLKHRRIDRELRQILGRCLEVDPQRRYANVQQILDDLRRRDTNQSRRPLLILGIAGPLLLLLATCFFASRSINRVSRNTTVALRAEAFGSNQLAARFAAQTLQTELRDYFDVVQDEAARNELLELLQQTMEQTVVTESLDQIRRNGSVDARDRLLDSDTHSLLDQYLDQRRQRFSGDDSSARRPQFATMFVTDRWGTILSIAYGADVSRDKTSAGRNFAYRTYFHGLDGDLSAETPIDSISPIVRPHLSAAFQSTATNLWKVAISTPIYYSAPSGEGDAVTRPDAVFVATVNLGDFRLLQKQSDVDGDGAANSPAQGSQVAVLVEAREGELQGTVLQHPLMDRVSRSGPELSQDRFQVDRATMDSLLDGGDVDYLDPMSDAPGGKDFDGPWIAAMQPVSLPAMEASPAGGADREANSTDFVVLVQYRLSDVLGPVTQLQRSLLLEGALSVFSVLLVTLSMWWVVRRVTDAAEDEENHHQESERSDNPEPAETMLV